ncbi:MAG: 30S ribosomal protein S4 [Nitrospinae bacterium]|nr:30S ribosomal protein S4 [Nitrospinota bacterium]
MARYRGSVCRLCRREGIKLFLKGERCLRDRCAVEKRNYAPGQHGLRGRKGFSKYGIQLREKQKAKRIYGILERQFRGYFKKAEMMKGVTGENLLRFLECRLDNVVYRLGFTQARGMARQFVRHGFFTVNGKRVNIPSYSVKRGDVIDVTEKGKHIEAIKESLKGIERKGILSWLEIDKEKMRGVVNSIPTVEDISLPIQEQLIVEFYSK